MDGALLSIARAVTYWRVTDSGPGGQTGCSHRIFQAAEMQENFRPPLVLEIIRKGRIDRIGHGGTIGKSNRRDDHLA